MSSTTSTHPAGAPAGALDGAFAGTRASVQPGVPGDACLTRLRARLARECSGAQDRGAECSAGGVVDAVLGSLLDAAPLVDPNAVRSVCDDELVRSAQTVQRAANIIEGARSTLAAEATRRGLHARRGEANSADTLANMTGLSGAAARRIERDAQTVGRHPGIAKMLGRGDINSDQAAAVAAADVPEEVRAELCEQAKSQPADQTRKTVRAAEAAWRQESDTQRRARQRAARTASMWLDHSDSMWNLRAKFDPLTGDAVHRRFVSAIQRNWRTDKHLPERERRSVQQRAADALTALITASNQPAAKPSAGPTRRDAPGVEPRPDTANTNRCADPDHKGISGDEPCPDRANGRDCAGPAHRNAHGDEPRLEAADTGRGVASADAQSVDAEWVVPSPSQMIVLTTLDNLRSQPASEASTQAPDHASAQAPMPAPEYASTQALDHAPTRASAETTAQAPAQAPPQESAQALAESSAEASRQASAETSARASTQASTEATAHAAPQASVEGSMRASTQPNSGGLLAEAGAAAVTTSGTVLNAADARRIACDAQVIPAVMGAGSEPLDIGRAARTVPAGIRRALVARDQGCVWPGCERAPAHCDAHHILHWADGGPTSLANLALLCHSHHQRLHEYNLILRPPTKPSPPGEGWAVTPATGRKERTPTSDYTRQNR